MSNNNGTASAPSASSVTLNNGKTKVTAGVTDALKWEVTKGSSNFRFAVPGSSDYLYVTNTNNGVRVGTNASNTFNITDNFLCHESTGRYIGVYSDQDWRCYTTIHANIADTEVGFYKKVEAGNHSITIGTITGDGTIIPSETSGNSGDPVTITATPGTGYELTALYYNDTPIDITSTPYSFTMPDADVILTATFSKIDYNITVSGTNGTVTTLPFGTANYGDLVTVTATPNSGFKVYQVIYTPSGGTATDITSTANNGVYSFNMPAANVAVAVTFIENTDLYILGQMNGRDTYVPNVGTKMSYDGNEYTADVFITHAYGDFTFVTALANNNDAGAWNYLNNGLRYGSGASGDFWGIDSETQGWSAYNTEINLYHNSEKNFRLNPGVYTITVNKALNKPGLIVFISLRYK